MSRFPVRPRPVPRPRPTAGPTPTPTPGPIPGTTFTLTTGSDTASANIFEGPLQIIGNFALQTLTNGDRLTGVGVNPTLNAVILENGTTTTPLSLAGIQTANISLSALGVGTAAAPTLNVQSANALTSFSVANATAAFNAVGFQNALSSITITNSASDTALTFADAALAGPANSVTLTLNGVTAGNIVSTVATAGASGYETVNLVSNGFVANAPAQIFAAASNTSGYTTLNISGAAPTTLAAGATPTTATTVNGSSATGVINYTVPGAGNFSFTGGSANDIADFSASYTTADTINGGAGVNVLRLAADEATAASAQANVTNISDVRIDTDGTSSGAVTYTPGNFGGARILSLAANQTANGAIVNFASGIGTYNLGAFEYDLSGTGSLNLNSAGTGVSDTVNILYSGAAQNIIGGALNTTGAEVVNIANTGTGAATIEGALTITPSIGGTRTLNIAGSQQVVVLGNITSSIISAAAQTAGGFSMGSTSTTITQVAANITGSPVADRLGGSAQSDIISGGAGGADILNGQGAADLLTGGGGSGQDTFNFSATTAGIDGTTGSLSPATSYSLITDFVVGTTAAASDVFNVAFGVSFPGTSGLTTVSGTAVGSAGAVNGASVAGGQVIVLGNSVNFIKFTNAATTAGNVTADAAFSSVIGAGSITASTAGNADILATFYDAANGQAVVGYIEEASGANAITSADNFNVLSTVTMSAADYLNFGPNQLNFAAASGL